MIVWHHCAAAASNFVANVASVKSRDCVQSTCTRFALPKIIDGPCDLMLLSIHSVLQQFVSLPPSLQVHWCDMVIAAK